MKPLTEAMQKLVALDEFKRTTLKQYHADLEEALAQAREELGLGGFFEAEDGTVFRLERPKFLTTPVPEVSYVRTKRPEESAGGHVLAMKTAQEARASGLVQFSGKAPAFKNLEEVREGLRPAERAGEGGKESL